MCQRCGHLFLQLVPVAFWARQRPQNRCSYQPQADDRLLGVRITIDDVRRPGAVGMAGIALPLEFRRPILKPREGTQDDARTNNLLYGQFR